MKTIKTMLCAIVTLFGLTAVSNAASLNGLYFEVGSSAVGVEAAGSHNDAQGAITTGAVGKTAVTASYGLGMMLGKDKKLGIDFGYLLTPGEAKLKSTSDSLSKKNVSLELSDATEYYVAPMLNISDDASLYLKYGWNSTDLKVIGDVNKINSMDGTTVALGTVMSWGSNLYIRSEAGMTEYDTLKFTGLGSAGGILASETVTASPEVHYGKISIGYKF
jgi:hypothetical protein